jgi:hypothetical protein
MVQVLITDDAIQKVVCAALATDHAEVDAPTGIEMFTALRCEFPAATIVTLSLAELLEAAHTSRQTLRRTS